MTPDTAIAIRKPADLVDAAPYVIGFHPTESLVVLGLSGSRVFFGARYDLPPPEGDDIVQLGAVIAAQRARCVALLAYGPPSAVDPVIERALAVFDAFRVRVLEAIRVHDGRWWSYFCSDPGCCPADGTPFDTATSVIAAEATYRGQVALPSRQALVAQIAPVGGAARAAMTAATSRAQSAHDALITDEQRGARAVRRAVRLAVREAEKRYRGGRALTDDEIAWLGVLLQDPAVHEYALDRLGGEQWRLALWTDVLRRVEPAYVAGAGSVLSYLAWRAGQGALARVAVDRALQADPHHPMTVLLDEVLGLGIGPHALAALDHPPGASRTRPARAAGGRPPAAKAPAGPSDPTSGEASPGGPASGSSTSGESAAGVSSRGASSRGASSRGASAGGASTSGSSSGRPSPNGSSAGGVSADGPSMGDSSSDRPSPNGSSPGALSEQGDSPSGPAASSPSPHVLSPDDPLPTAPPSTAPPSSELPSTAPPSSEVPSSGLPSSAPPSVGLPPSGLPPSGLPSSGLPSSGKPPSAAERTRPARRKRRLRGVLRRRSQ